jgi:hypothetical protein
MNRWPHALVFVIFAILEPVACGGQVYISQPQDDAQSQDDASQADSTQQAPDSSDQSDVVLTSNWQPLTDVDAPSGRESHTAIWTGSKMIVWGGYDGSYLNSGGIYTP